MHFCVSGDFPFKINEKILDIFPACVVNKASSTVLISAGNISGFCCENSAAKSGKNQSAKHPATAIH